MNASRPEPGEVFHPLDNTVFWTLLAIVAMLPWPWGGNSDLLKATLGLVCGLFLLVLSLGWAGGWVRVPRFHVVARLALLLWLLWLAWILLQIIPLSPEQLERISPAALEQHLRIQEAGVQPFYTLSIAPGLTINAFLDSLAYLSIYVGALILLQSRQRIRLMLWALLISGASQALYGIHMTLTGIEYGFFEPKVHVRGVASGTFVNRNHFAAYLVITAAAGIGLVLADLRRWRSGGWSHWLRGLLDLLLSTKFQSRVLLVAVVIGLVLSRSRMGNIAFFSSLAVAGAVLVVFRMRRWFLPATLLILSFFVIDLWIVSGWFGLEKVVQRIQQTEVATEQRALVLDDLIPVAAAYQHTGAGLGSFAHAYAPYQDLEIPVYYDHAHNEYAEFLVETGWPGLGLLGCFVALHLLHAMRVILNRRRNLYAGAAFACLMASLAIVLHATAEFMLRIPAVTVTWLVLLAMCMGLHPTSRQAPNHRTVSTFTESAGVKA